MTPKERIDQILEMAEADGQEVVVIYGDSNEMEKGQDNEAGAIGVKGSGKMVLFSLVWITQQHPNILAAFLQYQSERIQEAPQKSKENLNDIVLENPNDNDQ